MTEKGPKKGPGKGPDIHPDGVDEDGLPPTIEALARHLFELQAQARELGIFPNDRELLECPECGLMEDVISNGLLITDFEDSIGQDTGMRFEEISEAGDRFRCPNCGGEVALPDDEEWDSDDPGDLPEAGPPPRQAR